MVDLGESTLKNTSFEGELGGNTTLLDFSFAVYRIHNYELDVHYISNPFDSKIVCAFTVTHLHFVYQKQHTSTPIIQPDMKIVTFYNS